VLELSPAVLGGIELPPNLEHIRPLEADSEIQGVSDDLQHFLDLCLGRFFRHLGEPFWGEQIGGNAAMFGSVDVDPKPGEGEGHFGHGGDAITERHAGMQIDQVNFGAADGQFHDRGQRLADRGERPSELAGQKIVSARQPLFATVRA